MHHIDISLVYSLHGKTPLDVSPIKTAEDYNSLKEHQLMVLVCG